MTPVRILKQDYHRNGIGGEGFVVSLFEWGDNLDGQAKHFIGISFGDNEQEFIKKTAVLNISALEGGNIEFAQGNSWRGSDHCGPALAEAWIKSNPDYFER